MSPSSNREPDLLAEIRAGALQANADLPTLLRKCLALGGDSGSGRLRDWAHNELNGYPAHLELPPYRTLRGALLLDGATMRGRVTGQPVPYKFVDPDLWETLQVIKVGNPIAELVQLVSRGGHQTHIPFAPPRSTELVALINHDLAKAEDPTWRLAGMGTSQVVERIYWSVSVSTIEGLIDSVRTALVNLVVEMRAFSPPGQTPTQEVAEQAVEVAIYGGRRNRVVVNQAAPGSTAVASTGPASAGGEAESRPRKVMWWIAGIAGVVAAIAAVIALLVA